MVNPFSRKGGLKRHKTLEKSDAGRRGRKNRRTEDKVVSSPPPSASENSFEEQSDDLVSEGEEVVYKEPSVYDNLLKSLRSGNDTIAEEGGKSDTEEDVDDESESLSMTEEEDDSEEGIDTESPKSHAMVSKLKSASMAGVVEQSEDTEDEDDEASDMDIFFPKSSIDKTYKSLYYKYKPNSCDKTRTKLNINITKTDKYVLDYILAKRPELDPFLLRRRLCRIRQKLTNSKIPETATTAGTSQ